MAGRRLGGKVVAGGTCVARGVAWVEGVALSWVQCARAGQSVTALPWWARRAACLRVSVPGVCSGSSEGGWWGGGSPSSGWDGWQFVRVCGRALGGV